MAKSSKDSKKGKGSKEKPSKIQGKKEAVRSKKGNASKADRSKAEEEPSTIDFGVQTCPNSLCYLCCFKFVDETITQAHVLLLSHAKNNFSETQLNPVCRLCRQSIPLKWSLRHKCCSLKALSIHRTTTPPVILGGPPFHCLYCRGKGFKSRSDLIVHLLAFHRPNRPRGQCGLCSFHFDETPLLPPPLPPPNADLQTLKQYNSSFHKAELSEMLKLESAEPKAGEAKLEKHCAIEHGPLYRAISRKMAHKYACLHEPYTCLLCRRTYQNNWDFQLHVLCRHGQASELLGRILVCAMCGEASVTEEAFDKHVQFRHSFELRCLAEFWSKNELLQDYVCCSTTCATCWECFEEDFELQAHLLVAHTAHQYLQCGWCKAGFSDTVGALDVFLIFLNHERNHARELHAIALEMHMTTKIMPPKLLEDMSKEAVEVALKALAGGDDGEEPKSGKSKSKGSKEGLTKSKKMASKSKNFSKEKSKTKGSKK